MVPNSCSTCLCGHDHQLRQVLRCPRLCMQLFCDDKRAELKATNPDTPFAEMAKLLGAAWKGAAPEEKATYQEQHAVRFSLGLAYCPITCPSLSLHE
jgi:HMG (high mobility group) box